MFKLMAPSLWDLFFQQSGSIRRFNAENTALASHILISHPDIHIYIYIFIRIQTLFMGSQGYKYIANYSRHDIQCPCHPHYRHRYRHRSHHCHSCRTHSNVPARSVIFACQVKDFAFITQFSKQILFS